MNVHYVTMVFPAPSETFASNDVRALRDAGVHLSVHSMLPPHPRAAALVRERGLDDVPLTFGDTSTILEGLGTAVRRPRLLVTALRAIFRHCLRKPVHVAKSLALVPRALSVVQRLDREDPDIVHIYWGHFPSLVGYLIQETQPDVPVTISLGAYDLEYEYGLSGPVARRAAFVRTNSTVNVKQIRDRFGVPEDDIEVVYNGIDIDYVERADRRPGLDPALDPKDAAAGSRQRIVSAGSLKPHKRMDAVLRVFARVLPQNPDTSLILLGDGPERQDLHRLAQELGVDHAVEFRGHVPHEQVHLELAQADVFLFLSQGPGERLPNVIKEAMANRCACVVSSTPGIEELIPDEEHGYVVGSEEGVAAERLDRLLRDPVLRQRVGAKARAYVIEHFDRRTSIARYLELWSSIATATRMPPEIAS